MCAEAAVQRLGTLFRNDEPERLRQASVFDLAINEGLP